MLVRFIGGTHAGDQAVPIPPPQDIIVEGEHYERRVSRVAWPGLVEEYFYILVPKGDEE
jgi:hypothetical protein